METNEKVPRILDESRWFEQQRDPAQQDLPPAVQAALFHDVVPALDYEDYRTRHDFSSAHTAPRKRK